MKPINMDDVVKALTCMKSKCSGMSKVPGSDPEEVRFRTCKKVYDEQFLYEECPNAQKSYNIDVCEEEVLTDAISLLTSMFDILSTGWTECSEGKPPVGIPCIVRYYNSQVCDRLTDIAWIDEEGNWQFTRENGGYFPYDSKKNITHWMISPGDNWPVRKN